MTLDEKSVKPWPLWGSLDPANAVKRRSDIAVGCVVFVFDLNCRVYTDKSSGPDPRHHYVPREVVGETSRSWLIGRPQHPVKIPKVNPAVVYGLDDVEDALWASEYRYRIVRMVEMVREVETLREIAKLVGFKP